MCGRFALEATTEELARHFHLLHAVAAIEPRYNNAPSQHVAVIRDKIGGYRLSMLRWGLIPHWSKDEKIGSKLINARVETISEKPSFRESFKSHRCLIPAT